VILRRLLQLYLGFIMVQWYWHLNALCVLGSTVVSVRFWCSGRVLLPSSASWEDLEEFQLRYPTFQLEDELLHEGGRDVMWGKVYKRRSKKTQEVG